MEDYKDGQSVIHDLSNGESLMEKPNISQMEDSTDNYDSPEAEGSKYITNSAGHFNLTK